MSLKDKITSYKEKESKFEEFKKQFGEILEKANELREIAMEKCGKLAFNRTTGIAALSILAISIGCGIGTQMYKDYMRKNGPITPTYSLSQGFENEIKFTSPEDEKIIFINDVSDPVVTKDGISVEKNEEKKQEDIDLKPEVKTEEPELDIENVDAVKVEPVEEVVDVSGLEDIPDEILEKLAGDDKKDLTKEEIEKAVDIGVER